MDRKQIENYLEKTLQLTDDMFIKPLERQRQKLLNFDYRRKKLDQIASIGFFAIITMTPYLTYRSISDSVFLLKYKNSSPVYENVSRR
ncbi:MAG: hypothetical protein AABW65_00880, partial [Nanoarchaeota archaeon]